MNRLSALYLVPPLLRMLTAAGALVTFLSLPTLLRGSAWLSALPVIAAGLLCLSITLSGRDARESDRG